MYTASGYLGDFGETIIDTHNRIAINSCGHYRLSEGEGFRTWRPYGRQDYQLIYITGGNAEFYFHDQRCIVSAESLVLLYPNEKQHYNYPAEGTSDVYWVHFSGTDAEQLLRSHQLCPGHIFPVSGGKECLYLFERIIRELQLKQPGFYSLTSLYMETLLAPFARSITLGSTHSAGNPIVEEAILHFHAEYHTPVSIQEYAASQGISCCWFIRTFKQHTGMTPVQYLTDIRINKAIELLDTGTFNIQEAAALVGYDNPLYFSRVFKKSMGVSPRKYIQNRSKNQPDRAV